MEHPYDAIQEARLRRSGFSERKIRTSQGGVRVLEARRGGVGRSIVLLHGFASRASDFHALVSQLGDAVDHIVIPDLPGHGRSTKPRRGMSLRFVHRAMNEALQVAASGRPLIFGASLGSLVALRYAAQYPNLVGPLVLASPFGVPDADVGLVRFVGSFDSESRAAMTRLAQRMFFHPPRGTSRLLRTRVRSPDVRALFERLSEGDALAPGELERVCSAVVFLLGEQAEGQGEHLEALFGTDQAQRVRTLHFARTHENPHLEAPAAVAEVIREVLHEQNVR